MFKKIVIPTDGSDLATQAGLRAVPLAKLAGASITVLFVQEPYPYSGLGEGNARGIQDYLAASRTEGLRAVERVVSAAQAEGLQVDSVVVEHQQPAAGIVAAAASEGADLIVMGSHGRSGLAKLMLGSVAAKVLALSPIPVLVMK